MSAPDGLNWDEDPEQDARSPTDSEGDQEAPSQAPREPLPENFRWGAVTRNEVHELARPRGRGVYRGIRRWVDAGVRYYTREARRQLELEAQVPVWEEVPSEAQCYEMPWPDDGEPLPLRLYDLGWELRRRRQGGPEQAEAGPNGPTPAAAALLQDRTAEVLHRELDEAARTLLKVAAHLHERGGRLGLLSPETVLLQPSRGGKKLILPDLGFVYQPRPGPRKGLKWLDPEHPFAQLWDAQPVRQQEIGNPSAFGTELESGYVRSDLKTVARLLGCVLSGLARREVPAHTTVAGEAQKEAQDSRLVLDSYADPRTEAAVWQVLYRVLAEEIVTAAAFLGELERAPLSHHFTGEGALRAIPVSPFQPEPDVRVQKEPAKLEPVEETLTLPPPPPPPRRVGMMLSLLLGLLVVGGITGASVWYVVRPTGGPVSKHDAAQRPTRELTERSHLFPLVRGYLQANDPNEKLTILKQMWAVKLSWDDEEQEFEKWWREHLRWLFVEARQQQIKPLVELFERRPAQSHTVFMQLKAMSEELETLQTYPVSEGLARKEQACREQLKQLLASWPSS